METKIKAVFVGQNPKTAAPFIIISNNLNAVGNLMGMLHYSPYYKNPLWYQPSFPIYFLWPKNITFTLCESDTTDLILLSEISDLPYQPSFNIKEHIDRQ